MKISKNIVFKILVCLLFLPVPAFSGANEDVKIPEPHIADGEISGVYDLRDRKTYVQITNIGSPVDDCIHVQIFQQDRGCTEIDFFDELTDNDTVIYDFDNIIRNNGNPVPVSLQDDSYGYFVISSFDCATNSETETGNNLIGNIRIIDEIGNYEYRSTTQGNSGTRILEGRANNPITDFIHNLILPFNTLDGASHADVYGAVWENDADLSGNTDVTSVRNVSDGLTFFAFQLDENEERVSCDQVTLACDSNFNLHYGLNTSLPPSRGNNFVCPSTFIPVGEIHGYQLLEPAAGLDNGDENTEQLEFTCFYGLNNGNGTGSMDDCRFVCVSDNNSDCTSD